MRRRSRVVEGSRRRPVRYGTRAMARKPSAAGGPRKISTKWSTGGRNATVRAAMPLGRSDIDGGRLRSCIIACLPWVH
jgi:hypothetical protein